MSSNSQKPKWLNIVGGEKQKRDETELFVSIFVQSHYSRRLLYRQYNFCINTMLTFCYEYDKAIFCFIVKKVLPRKIIQKKLGTKTIFTLSKTRERKMRWFQWHTHVEEEYRTRILYIVN